MKRFSQESNLPSETDDHETDEEGTEYEDWDEQHVPPSRVDSWTEKKDMNIWVRPLLNIMSYPINRHSSALK